MSDPFEGRPFPRAMLIGAAILIGFSIALAAFVRMTGIGKSEMTLTEPAASRLLRFAKQDHGKTLVYAVTENNALIDVLDSGEDGFIVHVLHLLSRQRIQRNLPEDAPYLISLRADGRLILEDPLTGEKIDPRAFGPDHVAAVNKLFTAPARPTPPASAD